jgi:molecular chaperone DnaK
LPQIEVGFDIDANGILHVSAKDLGTGKSQKITITASSGLSKDEVEKMRKDAEAHAEEDKRLREQVELKNRSDARLYETEKLMKEHKDILSDDQRKKLEEAVEKLKDAIKRENYDDMKTAEEKLTEAWHAVSSDIYAKAREKSGAGAAPGGPAEPQPEAATDAGAGGKKPEGKEGDVVDADFEMVDDDKKKT